MLAEIFLLITIISFVFGFFEFIGIISCWGKTMRDYNELGILPQRNPVNKLIKIYGIRLFIFTIIFIGSIITFFILR